MIKEIIIVAIGIFILAKIHRKRIVELENRIKELEFLLQQKVQFEFEKITRDIIEKGNRKDERK